MPHGAKAAKSRTQAVFLTSDIAERIEANKAASRSWSLSGGENTSVAATSAFECGQVSCNGADLAVWDIKEWGQTITNLLPQASLGNFALTPTVTMYATPSLW